MKMLIINHHSVLSAIPEENRIKGVKTLDLNQVQLPMERALGVFTFSITSKHKPVSRRGILSTVSSIFDPLAFFAPVILPAKQILQNLCKMKFSWDEPIPVEIVQTWGWMVDLELLNAFSVCRGFTLKSFGEVTMAQLSKLNKHSQQHSTADDISTAEEAIVRFVQRKYFGDDTTTLSTGTVKKSSHLYKLDPVITDRVVRVGGRLSKSALPEEAKHPAILPKASHVSNLILQYVHRKVGHRGRNHMLSTLRWC